MSDEFLRRGRLVYYQEDIEQIERLLMEFLKLSNSKGIFLVDKEGHLVTQKGMSDSISGENLSALVAGSFAATKEIAKMIGEAEFSFILHQGKRDHIQMSRVSDRAILAIVFDEKTTTGMVTLYSGELAGKIEKIFEIASKKVRVKQEQVGRDFTDSAKDRLDDLFKD